MRLGRTGNLPGNGLGGLRGSGRRSGLHSLVGAYAMDAVTDGDRAAFERHLPGCEQCRDDLRGLRETTARLAEAAAIRPRPQLREQTLQAAGLIRQLPPVTEESGRRRHRRTSRASASRSGALGVLRRPWLVSVAGGLAVVLAGTAVVLGLHAGQMQRRLTAAQQRDASIAAIMGAHDAVRLTAHVTTGGMATVVMSHQDKALVFVASGLARLPASKAYELWLMGPEGDRPAGMVTAGGHQMMVVRKLAAGDQLGLTVEPADGAPQPTTAPLVMMGLGG
jgi:Anti-sigma-K factor rskA, C-terminal/Putative zinc-finger